MENPEISIILPVFNGELFLKDSIDSILNQTFKNFELIVINDGSTDKSEFIIKNYNDSRIKYFSQENKGLAESLNFGLKIAKGKYIARQDADDISIADRLEKQFNFLENNKSIGLVGTWAQIINEKSEKLNHFHKHPTTNNEICFFLLFNNPFVHSSVMFKQEIINECGLYNSSLHHLIQDYNYWFQISKKYKLANIPENLILYREVNLGISKTTKNYHEVVMNESIQYMLEIIKGNFNEISNFSALYHHCYKLLKPNYSLSEALSVLKKLKENFKTSFNLNNHDCLFINTYEAKIKRSFYNFKIYHDKSTLFEKISFRILRKILFITHKKDLN